MPGEHEARNQRTELQAEPEQDLDRRGIPLDSVAVSLEGDLDLRGFFGGDHDVSGFAKSAATVTLQKPRSSGGPRAPQRRTVDAHCPVLDLHVGQRDPARADIADGSTGLRP